MIAHFAWISACNAIISTWTLCDQDFYSWFYTNTSVATPRRFNIYEDYTIIY